MTYASGSSMGLSRICFACAFKAAAVEAGNPLRKRGDWDQTPRYQRNSNQDSMSNLTLPPSADGANALVITTMTRIVLYKTS
jgi:hypothetical protein